VAPVGADDLEYYREEYDRDTAPWSRMRWLDEQTESWLNDLEHEIGEPRRALDLGCGEGRISRLLAQKDIQTIGLDYLQRVFPDGQARDRGNTSVRFVRADAMMPPFPGNSFSCVVDYGFLHHVRKSNWPRYRDVVTSLLATHGFLFLNVFHRDDAHANNTSRPWVYHRGHYDRFFTEDTLSDCLGETVLIRQSRIVDEDSDHVFLSALCEYVGNNEAGGYA